MELEKSMEDRFTSFSRTGNDTTEYSEKRERLVCMIWRLRQPQGTGEKGNTGVVFGFVQDDQDPYFRNKQYII